MATMIRALSNPETMRERAELAQRAEFAPVELMGGRDQQALEDMMAELFKEHDKDGNGVLDPEEFENCLHSTELGLAPADIDVLMDMSDQDGDRNISYAE